MKRFCQVYRKIMAIAICIMPIAIACSLSPTSASQIRIGTFNLQNFDGVNNQKLASVSKIIDDNFDVIGLQEISPIGAEKLKGSLPKWEFILGETGQKQRVAVFYRRDLLVAQRVTEWRTVNITGTLRSPLVTYLKTNSQNNESRVFDFTLVVLHQKGGGGKDSDRIRQNQSDRLGQEVKQYQAYPQSDPDLILLGDFNSPSWADQNRGLRDLPITFLTKAIETDAKENCLKKRGQPKFADGRLRFTNRGTGCVIDHIAVSQLPKGAEEEYIPNSVQILAPQKDLGFSSDRQYFSEVSDHLPVRAVFTPN